MGRKQPAGPCLQKHAHHPGHTHSHLLGQLARAALVHDQELGIQLDRQADCLRLACVHNGARKKQVDRIRGGPNLNPLSGNDFPRSTPVQVAGDFIAHRLRNQHPPVKRLQ